MNQIKIETARDEFQAMWPEFPSDIEYFKRKLAGALKVPDEYLRVAEPHEDGIL